MRTLPDFVPVAILKRDHFSTIVQGHAPGAPGAKRLLRDLTGLPWWTRGLARWLARREARALAAAQGIDGVPLLIRAGRDGILRGWAEGLPLNLDPPREAAWYRDARRILRALRRRGVSHNDLAKPQNWLNRPGGRAGVIDFQLAQVHRRRGRLARLMAREDLRHLLKQKRRYAPALLTATERRMLARRSWPAALWRATGKRLYRFVTRRLIGWSDGEGAGTDRAPALAQALRALPGVREAVLVAVPRAGGAVGLYAFVETDLTEDALPHDGLAYVQPVAALPRDAQGAVRLDALTLVALNRTDAAQAAAGRDPALAAVLAPILAGRRNLSDRHR